MNRCGFLLVWFYTANKNRGAGFQPAKNTGERAGYKPAAVTISKMPKSLKTTWLRGSAS
jgi:hypothetical protein